MSASDPLPPVPPAGVVATTLVGPNPRGAVGRVSRAVRRVVLPLVDEGGTAVVLAVSGGADSLALGVCALDVCSRAGAPVASVTVDHGLREGSDAEARGVARLMGSLGAKARCVHVDAGSDGRGSGPEGSARDARWAALADEAHRWARECGCHRVVVLLGHTMDDQAETVLLGLARGSGPGSLRGMAEIAAPVGTPGATEVTRVRPLLGVRRVDTRACCTALGLEWVEDPTNRADGPWRAADGSALRRAAVREDAMPALARALGVDPVPALARSAALMAADDDALEAAARAARTSVLLEGDEAARRVTRARGGGADRAARHREGLHLDVRTLSDLEPALRDRVLHAALVEVSGRGGAVSGVHVGSVSELVTDWHGQGPLDVPGASVSRLPGAVLEMRARGGGAGAADQ